MNNRFALFLRICLLFLLCAGLVFQPQYSALAAANLTVTPLTWNVIGLDSNNVNVGPNLFPVGARVCNTGDAIATNVTATFVWDSANALISIRPGTNTTLSVASLGIGSCTDFYFEVRVTRSAAAYDTTRNYHIAVTADGGISASTPTPRALYVEHLVSQNRNAVTDIQYGTSIATLASVASGGTMTLLVGNTYYIRVIGFTATQGYEQLESFITIPNTIFQVLSVATTYTADTSANVSSPNDKEYGDACVWENDLNSPNYRACLSTGKVGGNITVTYQVKILQVPGAPLVNPQPLSTLIYDFSGSSYHYNSDFGVSTRYAFILDPSTLTIAKNFNPDPTSAGGISTLTFTLTNPNAASVSGLNFTDTLPTTPGAMTIASPTNASTTGCGTPTFAPVAGATSLSFSNGTIAANSTCTIKVNVTVPAVTTGTYTNTSNHLFINTLDTGNFATDTLTVNSATLPAPVCGLTMAQWTFAGFTVNPPPFPAASTQATNVTTAAISVGNGLTANADTTASGGNPQPGIRLYGWQNAGPVITATSAFIQFAIDTSQYSQVNMQFEAQRKSNGPSNDELYYSTNGTTWTQKSTFSSTTAWAAYGAYDFTGLTNTTGVTYFRIYGYGANATSSGNDLNLDNVTFTGCTTPVPPTITKAFGTDPIAVNGTSTLTFTLSNSNSIALTGVTFIDTLPTGLQVAATPSATTTCGGTPTWAPAAGATLLTFGSPAGASIPANSTCTVSVNIRGTASGSYQNVSGFISSTNGGTNTGSTGSASASLTVLMPPVISKLFAPNPILSGGTSTLTFTISNPNLNNALSGVAFSDTYPGGVTNTNPLSTSNTCGGTLTAAAGGGSLSLSSGSISSGSSCTITTTVTASTVNTYANTSGAVSSTNGGTGNTASDTLTVNAAHPAISIIKQIGTTSTGPWSSFLAVTVGANVYYQFTVQNDGDVPLTSVNVSDPLVSTTACAWKNGDGTTLTAPFTLPVASAANNQHVAMCVVGPVATTAGSHPNTATATGTYSPNSYTDTATATYATVAVTLAKSATETSFTTAGDLLHYIYLVTNSGSAPLVGPVTITDDKITLPNTVTCPAVSTVGDLDDWLDPGESLTCTATYTVTLADVIAGSVTNTASATVSGVTSNTSSKTVFTLRPDLAVTKTDNVTGSVAQNGAFNWTITVGNSGIATASFLDTFVLMSDTLPGVAAYYPQGALTVTNGSTLPIGTINCSITGTALSCVASGIVTLPIGSSFNVTFAVTPTAAGSLANTATVDPNGSVLEISELNNTGSDTVTVVASPSISKSFGAASVVLGSTTTLSFTITNPNATTALTGVAFSDTLPAGLSIANFSTTQCGGTLTTTAATRVISLSGATIAGGGTCTFSITVTASAEGIQNNITGNVTSTNGGIGNTGSASTTVIAPDLNVTKTDGSPTYTAGSAIAYTITVDNVGTATATGTVTDNLSTALTNITWTCAGTGTATCGPSGNGNINDAISIPAGQSVTYAINATVLSSATGNLVNTASASLTTGTDPTPADNSSTDTDAPDSQSDLEITKTDGIPNVAAGGTTTYTLRVTNNGPSDVTGAILSDAATTGLSKTAVACSRTPGQCLTAPTIAQLEGGSFALPALAFGQFYEITVSANVTATSGTVTNTATITTPSGTTDPTPGNNTASDTDNVININAVNDIGSTVNGTTGGQSLADVLVNDTLNGGPATLANVNLTQISTTNPAVTLDVTTGVVNVAPGTPAGNYTVTYQICDQANPTICDIATVTVPVVVIDAVNDTGSTVNGATGGPSLADVLANDTLNGNPATLANVNLTQVSTTNAGVTLDVSTGAVNVVPGTPGGNYTVTYQICDQANPTICDTATVTVPVVVIDAVNDTGSTMNGTTGGQSLANVLANDTLNGSPATLANVNLTQVSTTDPGVTLDVTTGAVNVAPGTAAGNYTITYRICDQANPIICDTATVSVPVVVIDAVNDMGSTVSGTTGGQSLADVLANDTVNGSPATLANVNLTQVSTSNVGVTLDVTTGTVNVAPGTPAGNYIVTYQICDQANPTICDTATVSVPVVVIDAVNDSGATVNGTTGGQALADVLTNDTLNGNPATLANVNLTQVSTTNPGVTLNPATGAVNVAPGTPSGNYTLTYQICDQANPTICDTATVSVPVVVINAVNDIGSNVNGTTGGQALADALANDTLNGNPATLANITLTQISTTNPGVTLDVNTGAVNVAPGTPAGSYTVTYQICDQANPNICDTAIVTVPVVVIDAVDDDFSGTPVNGYTGGTAGNAFANDTLNGAAVVPAQIITTVTSPASDPGVTLNTTTGNVTVAAGTPAGTYNIGYQICDQANPTICDTATITILVNPPAINAVDDNFSAAPVNGYTGGPAGNAFTNDTLNGLAIVPARITATVTTPASDPGVTLNTSTGSVAVAAGTPAGTYTIDYLICENLNPTSCDPATITVVVDPPVIQAVNDAAFGINGITGATAVLNVFDNDNLNGSPVIPSEVTLTEIVPDPSGALTLNPNGTVDVAPGTPAGTYQLTYSICEILNPTNCDTAIASVTVGLPPTPVAQNDSTTTPFNTPATLPNITANDTAYGTGNSIVINTIDLDPATAGLQTSFTDSNGNQWSVNTTTGDVTFTPAANYTGTAMIPYEVQDAAGQIATANLSVTVGPPASISGVVYNDADLNSTKSASEVGIVGVLVNLYDSTGTTLTASATTTAGGAYSFPNVTPGTYIVTESDPAGYVSSTPNSVSATVSAGGTATVNFGDYQLPNTTLSAITGVVFNDVNGNGIQNAGEAALSGVTVELRDNAGTVIATTTTNASGAYSFNSLSAGTYTVTETDPAGYISTTLNNVTVNLSAGTTATINFGDQISGNATIADPAVTKLGSPTTATVGSIVVYTITVGNNGNASATNVVLTDTKPAFLDIISITISPNPGLTPVITGNTFTINFGSVAPTDSYTVTVVTRVNSLGQPPGGSNNVSITTASTTDRVSNNSSSAALQIPSNNPGGNPRPSLLPSTGFAPRVITDLSDKPRVQYAAAGDIILEIPSLGVKIPVVGVPQKNGAWDVTWLGKQAGWLQGTAFPSWKGNSVLTSHVYLSDGLPGPFVNLNHLKYGDTIIIHAYGQKYIFEVTANQVVEPNDVSAFKHEEQSWLTLITCKVYDEKTNTYKQRVVIRAVLISVTWDK